MRLKQNNLKNRKNSKLEKKRELRKKIRSFRGNANTKDSNVDCKTEWLRGFELPLRTEYAYDTFEAHTGLPTTPP